MGNWFANPARQRGLLYAALLVGLLAARIPVGRAAWTGTAELHTSLETAVTVLALVIGAMALVHYSSHKSGAYLTLGLGFLAAGVVNGYHAVLTSPLCAACRLLHFSPPFSPWPERSAGLMLCILFAFALAAHWRQGEWKTDGFTSSLVLFLMVEAISQTSYLTFSAQPFDSLHTAAHVLKILSYVIVLTGLFHSILSTFRRASAAVGSLTRANESYAAEVERRERVEGELQQSREELEARVVARTADLAEQGGLSALASEIAILLTQGDDVPETLQRAAQLIVHFLEAAFVRVWTLNQAGNVLELQASAGMYTHLDGAHARVPVGQFKIGRIAREGQPHLTNDVQADSWVSDPEWARRERMIAFAGYPLMVGDSVVGVVAAFAHRPLSKAAYQTFGSLAGSIAQFLGRKRTEVALQDSEARVRLLLDSTAEAVYGIDLSGNCTLANRSCLRMLGYERAQDMLGRNIHDLIHHSYADGRPHPASECRILSAFERGEGTHADNEVLWRADGTSFPAEYWSYPVRKNGEIFGAVGTFIDITERKRVEDRLRASEERFRIAAENAGDMTFEWDLETGQVERFGGLVRRLGDRPAPQTFEAWKSMVHPDDLGAILAGIGRHIETGESYITEYRVLGESGNVYHYSLRGRAIRNAAGQPYKWIGLVSDITESKRAEAAISQLAAIVQCSEDAIIGTNLSGIITTWNGGAERLLSYDAGEALGRPLAILFHRTVQVWDILEPSSRGAVSRMDEAIFVRKDGLEIPVSLTVSPIRKTSGEITGVATIARDISARKKAEIELAHQAQHDHLTGLPNPLLLADRLASSIQRASRSGLMTAVIYVDLDGFKFVNDTLGHEAGDALLKQVTGRLQDCIREPDTLARMGGDEFMIVANEIASDAIAHAIAERLRTALHRPFQVDSRELYITASLGIAMCPRDGTNVSALRRDADAAMYEAKRNGKDRVLFFTPAMRDTFLEHLELETDLRRALDGDQELFLVYQPIFEAEGGRQTAFEALLRWAHPVLGLIPPGKFIPVAEESGLIFRLGAWVLEHACRNCRIWQDHGLEGVRVAANVSVLEFARPEFAGNVLRILAETGLPGDLLDLEVTETTLMRDMDEAMKKMSLLRAHGICISIDDFGTGYSSLGYLPRLPVDRLKIDRSFVAELGVHSTAQSLIEGIISLAHSIGKQVVVEGVETAEQLKLLRIMGCDEIQGFLLGRPAALPAWKKSLDPIAASELADSVEVSA